MADGPSPKLVLGVDPGTIVTGWGVVRREGARLHGLAAGVIRAEAEPDLPARLRLIYGELVRVVEQFQPTVMAVEDLFFARSVSAALKLGHARGVVLLAGANSGLPIFAYPPALVKRSVAGSGQASKEQVAQMIGAILGWRELPALDASDALAVAITHLNAASFSAPALLPKASRRRKFCVPTAVAATRSGSGNHLTVFGRKKSADS